MKRLFAWIFGWPLVWTRDHDLEVRLRRVHSTPWNNWVYGVGFDQRSLAPNGEMQPGSSYVKEWKPANKKAEELFK
jgi:hypothetical protein